MQYESLFLDFQRFTVVDIAMGVLFAFLTGLFISIIYRKTFSGFSYSPSFVNALVLLTMITTIVIMVIGNNLARAFGLVGAMSIIRFRTAVKDTRDIVFVFFALAGGMAAGSGNYMVGAVGVAIVGTVILVLFLLNFGSATSNEHMLRFMLVPDDRPEGIYLPVFRKYLKNFNLLNIKSIRMGQYLELAFRIELKSHSQCQAFINELNGLEGVERVSLIFDGYEEEVTV